MAVVRVHSRPFADMGLVLHLPLSPRIITGTLVRSGLSPSLFGRGKVWRVTHVHGERPTYIHSNFKD